MQSPKLMKRIERRYILLHYWATDASTAQSILSHVQKAKSVPHSAYIRIDGDGKSLNRFSILLINNGEKMKISTAYLTLSDGSVPQIIKIDQGKAYGICVDSPPTCASAPTHPFQCCNCRATFNKISKRITHEKDCNLQQGSWLNPKINDEEGNKMIAQ